VNPNPVVAVNNATICAGSTQGGVLSATVTVSTATPFTYAWTGPNGFTSSSQSIAPGIPGQYCVTVTDAHGCTGSACGTLTVNPRPTVTVANASICSGVTATLTAVVTGNAPFTYAWSGPSGFTGNTATVTVSVAGTYTVLVTDANGCNNTATATVTVNAKPVVVVPSIAICNGALGSLNAVVTGTGPFTYSWTGPSGFTATGNPISVSVAGTYTVTVTDANQCTGTATATVTVNPIPVVTVPSVAVCLDHTATLTATVTASTATPFTYHWTGPGSFTATGNPIAASAAGVYTVTVTDANGCVGTGTATVTVNQPPTVTVNNASVCAGTPATLTATVTGSSPFTYTWSGPAGFGGGSGPSITVTAPGTYIVLVTDSHGCNSTGSGTVTVNPLPTVVVPNVAICAGASGTLTAFASGNGPFTYSWTGPSGFTATGNPITVSVGGTYTVTVTDANHCTQTATGTVTVNPLPIVTVNSIGICSGSRGTLTATVTGSTAAPFTYSWTGPGGVTGTGASITVSAAGTYTVTVTDANGCVGTGSGTVTVNPLPVVTVNNAATCVGGTATLTASVTGSSATPFTYAWSGPSGFTASTPSVTVSAAGTYTVVVTDANGCVGVGTGTLTVNAPPTVTMSGVTVCAGSSATLTANVTGGKAPFSYLWTGPNGFSTTTSVNTISVTAGGSYTVTVTDANGCVGSATAKVTVDLLDCALAPQFCIICPGMTRTLVATPLGGVPPYTFVWKMGSTIVKTDTGVSTSSYSTTVPGYYTVTITDAVGCSSTCTGQVVVDTLACLLTANSFQVCNGNCVTLDASGVGGLAPFTFVWSTGESTPSISVCQPGTYTVSVKDANGCTASQTATVTSCNQCVTRDVAFWESHVVPPPRTTLSCVTLSNVFNLMPGGLMDLGFLHVNLQGALGLFWGNPVGVGSGGLADDVCVARKALSQELIAAIANVTLLNPNSSGCGVTDPSTGQFIPIATLIAEAQAATQPEVNILDCSTPGSIAAWVNEMQKLTALLHTFNGGGVALPLPAGLSDCGIGTVNVHFINANTVDPTTAANCTCGVLQ
jgi:hypothetical protein